MQNFNPVGWFEIYVSNMARARTFYGAVFQKELMRLPSMGEEDIEMFAFPWVDDAPGAAGALVRMPNRAPSSEGSIVYFSCDDLNEEAARVEAAGGTIVLPRMSIGEYGFIALVRDTEGNVIGLHSMR